MPSDYWRTVNSHLLAAFRSARASARCERNGSIVWAAVHAAEARYRLYLAEREERKRAEEKAAGMRKHLQWVANQPCRHEAEGSGSDCDCSETGCCITEWCLPCYARQALKDTP